MTGSRIRHSAASAAIAALAALAVSPARADQGDQVDHRTRPFKAAFITSEVLGFNPQACPAPPFLQGTTTATGVATQMGKATLAATDCIVPGDSSFTFSNGKLTLTAANGDTVTANYSGSLLPSAAYPIHTLSGSYQVTGGTGRFAGATGSGYLQGVINILSGKGAYEATGTLRY